MLIIEEIGYARWAVFGHFLNREDYNTLAGKGVDRYYILMEGLGIDWAFFHKSLSSNKIFKIPSRNGFLKLSGCLVLLIVVCRCFGGEWASFGYRR